MNRKQLADLIRRAYQGERVEAPDQFAAISERARRERAAMRSTDLAAGVTVSGDSQAPGEGPGEGQRPRVLLVDDNGPLRRHLHDMLSDFGIEVVGEAANAEDGFKLSVQLHPDVVVMDYRMPGVNGITATRMITSRLPQIRVVMLTVYDDPILMRQAEDAGAVAYIVKGQNPMRLMDTLIDAIAS